MESIQRYIHLTMNITMDWGGNQLTDLIIHQLHGFSSWPEDGATPTSSSIWSLSRTIPSPFRERNFCHPGSTCLAELPQKDFACAEFRCIALKVQTLGRRSTSPLSTNRSIEKISHLGSSQVINRVVLPEPEWVDMTDRPKWRMWHHMTQFLAVVALWPWSSQGPITGIAPPV